MFPLLGPPFLLIIKVGAFKRWIKDYCGEIVRAFGLYFIEIFIDFLIAILTLDLRKELHLFLRLC